MIRLLATLLVALTNMVAQPLATAGARPGVAARELYVAPKGPHSGSCTRRRPCRTLARADELAHPGTTVHVAAGHYSATTLRASGTAGARIRWVSDRRWAAKVSATSSGPVAMVAIVGAYVDVEGFDVTGRGGDGTVGIDVEGDYSRAIKNRVHNLAIPCGGSNGGAGIDLSGREVGHGQQALRNLVSHVGTGQPLGTCHLIHGIYATVPDVVIDNNIVLRSQADGIVSGHRSNNLIVANNTVVGNGEHGIDLGGSSVTRAFVVNNIVAYNRFSYGINECCGEDHPSGVHYIDNLSYRNSNDAVGADGAQAEITGELIAAPLFVNPAADNYHPRVGSPAIGSGTRIAAPRIDFDGNVRPKGAAVNRGAFSRPLGGTRSASAAQRWTTSRATASMRACREFGFLSTCPQSSAGLLCRT